ncbi:MAG: hypothetical protein JNM27_17510 [Leptospirales bacterium]|nr:hypothetical protein [Leptospirales bacterium]
MRTYWLAPLLLLTSCVLQDVRLPGPIASDAQYQFTTEDFKIVGTVEAEGEIKTVLGVAQWGGNGYSELYEKTKKLGGDEIMNYVFEIQSYSILTFVYNKATWKARGTAIQYSSRARK